MSRRMQLPGPTEKPFQMCCVEGESPGLESNKIEFKINSIHCGTLVRFLSVSDLISSFAKSGKEDFSHRDAVRLK